jgi:hypothetical protein
MRLFLIITLLDGIWLGRVWIRILYRSSNRGRILGPDDSFSIQEVLNHLHAVAHSSTLGLRDDSSTNLARLEIVE